MRNGPRILDSRRLPFSLPTRGTQSEVFISPDPSDGEPEPAPPFEPGVTDPHAGDPESSPGVFDLERDTDGDGVPDFEYSDNDNDGLIDVYEVQLETNPQVADTDGDGLPDGDEVAGPTDPKNDESDGDGWTDGAEEASNTNPLDPRHFPGMGPGRWSEKPAPQESRPGNH